MRTIPMLTVACILLCGGTIAAQAEMPDTITTTSGLKYVITKRGTGPAPKSGNFVLVHYTGTLTDGKVFDDSRKRNEPIAFPLGQGQVIKGWDEAIALLRVGDQATLIIPSNLAYGEKEVGNGLIPANSTLVFDVELVDIKEKTVGNELAAIMDEKGIAAAEKHFAAMKKRKFEGYYLSESELNTIGYRYLQANKTKEALAMFKMNVVLFPNSANVYDSLGEGCMMAGDKERAIYNYEKSLKLDPDNSNAAEMLKKLR